MKQVDVAIVGGGISGAALFYVLSSFTNIKKIALIEKYDSLARVSSNAKANSQTIHDGSIETNYTLEKAAKVKQAADKLMHYALNKNLQDKSIFECSKIALAVGEEECEGMERRFEAFSSLFNGIEFFNKDELKKLEPKVVEGLGGFDRPEAINAMGFKKYWSAMNFEAMSMNFVEEALKLNGKDGKEVEIFLNFKVNNIKSTGDGYLVEGNGDNPATKSINAHFVLVNAGSHSLPLAQRSGYGLDLGCLPVAGSFYFTRSNILRGKVYTVQNPKLPFAALHGDPDITMDNKTRLGPTALGMPKLERSKHLFGKLSLDLIKINANMGAMGAIYGLLKDTDIRNYVFRNFAFELPYFGKRLFLKDAKKIIPSLRVEDIYYAKGFGEVRPQVINLSTKKLELGEKKIKTQKGLTFNMTPSPGATSCLNNAKTDALEICEYLNAEFNQEAYDAITSAPK